MKNETHPGQWSGSTSPSTSTTLTDRLQQVAKLFAECHSELLRIASDDPRLKLPEDPGQILDGLERQLYQYDGPPTEPDFIVWAMPTIVRYRHFHAIMRGNESSVRAGLWRVLAGSTDLFEDTATADARPKQASRNLTIEILMSEVWLWCWQHLDALMTPGVARLSTRINQRAYWVARAWKTKRLRERDRHVDLSELEQEFEEVENS